VGVLQRFERRLGGLVEGTFAKVFKGEVQPVEIASALQREADDRKTIVAEGKVLVPNDYVVELGTTDYTRLSPYEGPLGKELASMVHEHADEQGYSFVGPVKVRFEQVGELDTGIFRVRSGVTAGDLVEERVVTHAGPGSSGQDAAGPGPVGALPGRPRLVLSTGGKAAANTPEARGEEQVFFLTHAVTVIGRGVDADLRLNDPGVSRRHAELRLEGEGIVLVDTGSTNGLRVNDVATTRRQLAPGDRVELGSTVLVYQHGED
jgi:hypothetical protein